MASRKQREDATLLGALEFMTEHPAPAHCAHPEGQGLWFAVVLDVCRKLYHFNKKDRSNIVALLSYPRCAQRTLLFRGVHCCTGCEEYIDLFSGEGVS